MHPLPEEGVDKNVGSSIMLVSGKEFLHTLKEEGTQGYALILKPKDNSDLSKNSKEKVPEEVQELLDKYKSNMVEDMPNTLPPMRDVSHQIDFILGSTFPNKPAYKMHLLRMRKLLNKCKNCWIRAW